MKCKKIKVQLKDGGVPYIFQESSLYLENNILCIESSDGFTYCFPIENIVEYIYKKE